MKLILYFKFYISNIKLFIFLDYIYAINLIKMLKMEKNRQF